MIHKVKKELIEFGFCLLVFPIVVVGCLIWKSSKELCSSLDIRLNHEVTK